MNRALFAALIAFVGLGIGAGFWAVGGPGYARMERNDAQRADDLRLLAEHYRCVDAPSENAPRYCGGAIEKPDVTDPVTDAPYLYTLVDGTHFELCATFETQSETERTQRNPQLYFAGPVGCLRYRRASAGAEWVQQ